MWRGRNTFFSIREESVRFGLQAADLEICLRFLLDHPTLPGGGEEDSRDMSRANGPLCQHLYRDLSPPQHQGDAAGCDERRRALCGRL